MWEKCQWLSGERQMDEHYKLSIFSVGKKNPHEESLTWFHTNLITYLDWESLACPPLDYDKLINHCSVLGKTLEEHVSSILLWPAHWSNHVRMPFNVWIIRKIPVEEVEKSVEISPQIIKCDCSTDMWDLFCVTWLFRIPQDTVWPSRRWLACIRASLKFFRSKNAFRIIIYIAYDLDSIFHTELEFTRVN